MVPIIEERIMQRANNETQQRAPWCAVALALRAAVLFCTFVFAISAAQAQVRWTISNDTAYRNGVSQFPIGFYYLSPYPWQASQRMVDLEKIADAGFNLLHTNVALRDASFMNRCAQRNVNVIIEFNDPKESVIAAYKNHPARAGYMVFDDVDKRTASGAHVYSQSTVSSDTSYVKSLDPAGFTWISAGYSARFPTYVGRSDAYGLMNYPIPAETTASTDWNYRRAFPSIWPYNQLLVGILQAFNWPGQRPPTPDEVRSMTYQALINGVKSLIYYAYKEDGYGSGFNMNSYPTLWSGFKQLPGEVLRLKDVWLFGERQKLTGNVAGVITGMWRYQGKVRVVVVNTNAYGVSYSVNIPAPTSTSVVNTFSTRPGGLYKSGSALVGRLLPLTTYVVEMNAL
jgi:hypothetical protein